MPALFRLIARTQKDFGYGTSYLATSLILYLGCLYDVFSGSSMSSVDDLKKQRRSKILRRVEFCWVFSETKSKQRNQNEINSGHNYKLIKLGVREYISLQLSSTQIEFEDQVTTTN